MAMPFVAAIAGLSATELAALGLVAGGVAAEFAILNNEIQKVNDALTDLDNTAKTARGLGLLADEMERFQHAADLTGLDNAYKILGRFQTRVGQARIEGGRYADMFKMAGLNVDEMDGSLDDLLKTTEALNKVQNIGERNFLAREITGARTAKGLYDLADGMDRANDVAERFGITLGDTAAVERANDRWGEIWKLFGNVTDRIASAMAPALEKIALVILDVAENGDTFKLTVEAIAQFVKIMADSLAVAVEQLRAFEKGLQRTFKYKKFIEGFIFTASFGSIDLSKGGGPALDDSDGGILGGIGKLARGGSNTVGAALRGSAAAFSTRFAGQTNEDFNRRTAEATEETRDLTRDLITAIEAGSVSVI